MHGAPGTWPRPFAVGVLALTVPTDGASRATARLDLALDAYELGYFLVDTIEIDNRGTGYLATELLVSRATPDALVTRGPVDTGWLHALANRHRLVIRPCEEHREPCSAGITPLNVPASLVASHRSLSGRLLRAPRRSTVTWPK